MNMNKLSVKTMAEYFAEGKNPDILYWVGSAGSFDDRAKKITKAFVKILNKDRLVLVYWEQRKLALEMPLREEVTSFCFRCKL